MTLLALRRVLAEGALERVVAACSAPWLLGGESVRLRRDGVAAGRTYRQGTPLGMGPRGLRGVDAR
jgi:hypothetical protein